MTRDRKPAGIGSFAPNQLLILNGVNTNLISRSLQNVVTNFLILRCVMMETGFHLDISNLTKTLRKNLFPSSVIENVVRKFLNNHFTSDSSQSVARKDNCLYFKLPYIGPFSIITQRRIKKLVTTFFSDLQNVVTNNFLFCGCVFLFCSRLHP